MTAPLITGLSSTLVFDENTVNGTPQIMDGDVNFTDPNGADFADGTLSLSGLLAEDTVSVLDVGDGTGEIGFDGVNVSFGGTVFGTLQGGTGTDLVVTFNSNADAGHIDALIQHLTYANTSDAPAASRSFVLNVTDQSGDDFGPQASGPQSFDEWTQGTDPLSGFDYNSYSDPTAFDFDGDGDLDIVAGSNDSSAGLFLLENHGSFFSIVPDIDNPFSDIFNDPNAHVFGHLFASPTFVDLDGDGDLDLVVTSQSFEIATYINGDDVTSGAFSLAVGNDNPFASLDGMISGASSFGDFDGDGDLDVVFGTFSGELRAFDLTNLGAGGIAELTGAANPFDGIDVGNSSEPIFFDFDGDGDDDLVVGNQNGSLHLFERDVSGGFTELTGTSNPFDGITVPFQSTPHFMDMDGDGDLDLVVGDVSGGFTTFENTNGVTITVNVTPENDAPSGSSALSIITATENLPSEFDLSGVVLVDGDVTDVLSFVISSDAGTFSALSSAGVTVAGTGTGGLTLTGLVANLNSYLADPSAILYQGPADATGAAAATVTMTVDDGSGAVSIGAIEVDIAPTILPTIAGFSESVTFLESDVNAGPQRIDMDVDFDYGDVGFDGGSLTLTGLLPEDVVVVDHAGGYNPNGIWMADSSTIFFGATHFADLSGGNGTDLVIDFLGFTNEPWTDWIDALLESLAYSNTSDAPTESREFRLNITDADGNDLGIAVGESSFADWAGGDPLSSIASFYYASPSFVDLDRDGDLDLVLGDWDGSMRTFINGTDGTSGGFNFLADASSPFLGINTDFHASPTFADIDGDGDQDLVLGRDDGFVDFYELNAAGDYVQVTGSANPFDGIGTGARSAPSFGDIDGDGDLDLVIGRLDGTLDLFLNGTTGTSGDFVEQSGSDNPFDGVDTVYYSSPIFVDVDGDGDLDLVLGGFYGTFRTFRNDSETTPGSFTELLGAANPFDGLDVGLYSAPGFVDVDGDGDLDLVAGSNGTGLVSFENTAEHGFDFTINVAPENDAPILSFLNDVTFSEDALSAAPQLLAANSTFTDPDAALGGGTVSVTGVLAEDVISVASTGTGAGEISLSGTTVSFGGVVIGSLSGGNGTDLVITLNADATPAGVEALLQSLTYDNSSDAPTETRDLIISVIDGYGASTYVQAVNEFVEMDAADNPFAAISNSIGAMPQFVDLNGDGHLDLVVGYSGAGVDAFLNDGAGGFTELTGSDDPFAGIGSVAYNQPTFVDLDGDGNLDMLLGNYGFRPSAYLRTENGGFVEVSPSTYGIDVNTTAAPTAVDFDGDGDMDIVIGGTQGLTVFENDGAGTFTDLGDGAANPLQGIVPVGIGTNELRPTFADIDSDGDLDLVIGTHTGGFRTFVNDGTFSFTELLGADNPFDGIDIGFNAAPVFYDVDGDGDLDMIAGNSSGELITFENLTSNAFVTITVTPDNDPISASGLPASDVVAEDQISALDLTGLTLTDPDVIEIVSLTLSADAGTLWAQATDSVSVVGNATGTLVLQGTAGDLNAFLDTIGAVSYLGEEHVFGDAAATLAATATDDGGTIAIGSIVLDIVNTEDGLGLGGVPDILTFGENAVNAGQQLLFADASFFDVDPVSALESGALTLTGLLAEDIVSVRDQGTAAGQISLAGATVSYGGVAIATVTGGVGGDLSITFLAGITVPAVEALIQNLTFHNPFDDLATTRDLILNVTDTVGGDFGSADFEIEFSQSASNAHPFTGIDFGFHAAPSFADFDGDGDLDMVLGDFDGSMSTFVNDGTGTFTELTGAANPFDGEDFNFYSTIAWVDINNDGLIDLVKGTNGDFLYFYENLGGGDFTLISNSQNPFAGFDLGFSADAAFGDLNGDGAADAVIGNVDGELLIYLNDGQGGFVQQPAPFVIGSGSKPSLFDLDGDGDLDLITKDVTGNLRSFSNDGTGVFTELSAADNPFSGITLGAGSDPTFFDSDGDGDLDLIVGMADGTIAVYENTTQRGELVTVEVTLENDPVEATGLPATAEVEDENILTLDLSSVTLNDPDGVNVPFALTIQASAGQVHLMQSAGGVIILLNDTSSALVYGTAADLEAYLQTEGAVQYTGEIGNYGDGAATIALIGNDGIEQTEFGSISVDIIDNVVTHIGQAIPDVLIGDGGQDILIGGAGADTMTGGASADVFVFDQAVDSDVITDFVQGEDLIDLTTYFGSIDAAMLVANGAGKAGQDLLLGHNANIGNANSDDLTISVIKNGADTILEITKTNDVFGNGSSEIDLTLTLSDFDGLSLTVDDFIL